MARSLIFMLHGMGNQPEGWAGPYVDAIKEAYGLYPFLQDTPIEERLAFVPLQYDDIFREIVQTWADNAALVRAAAKELNAPVSRLTNWLVGADELKDNFAWTHAADVLLYRAFALVRNRVCTHVGKQLTVRIKREIDEAGSCSWSAIGHSLGTAVLHDTLARLWNPLSNLPGNMAFAPENAQADLVMMVANVSRLLEVKSASEPYDVFETAVKPGFGGQLQRGCKYYVNVRHRLDPFTVPKMFNPQMWPDEAALAAIPPRYLNVEVDHIHEKDIHSFAHYLKHPAVHVPMLRRLLGPQAVSDDEFRLAIDRFRVFGPLEDAAAIELKTKLESILPSQAADWLAIGKLRNAWKRLTGK